ncbi:hypothetical protein IWZ00DRAFT_121561 [Phyllosticta capitalensis]
MPGGVVPPTELAIAWQTDLETYPRGERRGNEVIIIVTVLLFLTLWILAARLWARVKVQHNAGLDDILIVIAAVPTFGLGVAIILGHIYYGFDRHAWELDLEEGYQTRKITFAIALLYVVGTGLTKVSILSFYRRLGSEISPRYVIVVQAAIVFVVAYMITFTVAFCVGCRPINAFWRQLDPRWRATNEYKCFDEAADVLAASAVSLVQDLLACGLPLLIMWQLSIPRRQKIALSGVFSLGSFLCVVGAIRIYYIYRVYFVTYDTTWAAGHVWIWTSVEACLGIACASAPALRLFFRRVLGGASMNGSSGYSHRLSRSWGIASRQSGTASRLGRWSHLSSKIRRSTSDMDFMDASNASGGDGLSLNSTTTSEIHHSNHLHSISEIDYSSPKKTPFAESIQEIDEDALPEKRDEEYRIGSLQWVNAPHVVPGELKGYHYPASEPTRARADALDTLSSKKSSPSLQSMRSARSQQSKGSASPKTPAQAHLRTSNDSNDRPHPPPPPTCTARHYNQTHLPPIRPPPPHTSTSATTSPATASPRPSGDRPYPPPSCTARHYNQTHLPPIRPPPPHPSSSSTSPSTTSPKTSTDRQPAPPSCTARHYNQTHLPPIRPPPPHTGPSYTSPTTTTSSPATGTGTKSNLPPITPSPPERELMENEQTATDTDDDVINLYSGTASGSRSPSPASSFPLPPTKSPSFSNWPLPAPSSPGGAAHSNRSGDLHTLPSQQRLLSSERLQSTERLQGSSSGGTSYTTAFPTAVSPSTTPSSPKYSFIPKTTPTPPPPPVPVAAPPPPPPPPSQPAAPATATAPVPATAPAAAPPKPAASPSPEPTRPRSNMLMDTDLLFAEAAQAAEASIAAEKRREIERYNEQQRQLAAQQQQQQQAQQLRVHPIHNYFQSESSTQSSISTLSLSPTESRQQRDMWARRGGLPGGTELGAQRWGGDGGRWGGNGNGNGSRENLRREDMGLGQRQGQGQGQSLRDPGRVGMGRRAAVRR